MPPLLQLHSIWQVLWTAKAGNLSIFFAYCKRSKLKIGKVWNEVARVGMLTLVKNYSHGQVASYHKVLFKALI